MAKTACPIDRATFRTNAKPVAVSIDGNTLPAMVKEFSTGSLGWFASSKTTITVNGVPCQVQVGLNLTIVGSKELPLIPAPLSDVPTHPAIAPWGEWRGSGARTSSAATGGASHLGRKLCAQLHCGQHPTTESTMELLVCLAALCLWFCER